MYPDKDHHLYGLIVWEGKINQCTGIARVLLYAIQKGYIEGTELPDQAFTNKGQTVTPSLITKNYINNATAIQTLVIHVFDWWGIVPMAERKKQWPLLLHAHIDLLSTIEVPDLLLADFEYQNVCQSAGFEATKSFKQIAQYLTQIQSKADEHYINAHD